MLVDELFIPHRAGTIRVPIHERVTVFAGLGETGRNRMARLFVGALAGAGPACIGMRDSSGDRALDPADRCDLLDVLVRISDRSQIVLLTDDPVTTTWARHHAERGELRLVDLAATAPSR